MRKVIFLIAFFCTLTANAQTYQISFAGSGASSTVESVIVENLKTGVKVNLNGDDILGLNLTTGINSNVYGISYDLKVFPNPSAGSVKIRFTPPAPGEAMITLYDVTGRQVTSITNFIQNHPQEFQLSGLGNGLYVINIKGNPYNYSAKILSNSHENDNIISIQSISNNSAGNDKPLNNEAKGSAAIINMQYTSGDRLKFTGTSGEYSTVIVDNPAVVDNPVPNKTITFNFTACSDGDGNHYPVVEIGRMIWMAENLKTTKYFNGDAISTTTPAYLNLDLSGETNPKYQWAYGGNNNYVATYGRLFTWYAATDSRGICPTGWYCPADGDWDVLITSLGGYYSAHDKLMETGAANWVSPNSFATNETGFTARPGGYRDSNGEFYDLGEGATWLSSTEYNSTKAWYLKLPYYQDNTIFDYESKKDGMSIRCVKAGAPVVITRPVTTPTYTTAWVGGTTSYGGSSITDRGVYWGKSQNPVTTGTKLQIGTGPGKFSLNLSDLTNNTTYYVTAYAVNSDGVSYGEAEHFTTKKFIAPSLSTKAVTSITQAKAISGGNVTSDGGQTVTARGVCWSTSEYPTILDSHTSDGTGTGSFTSYIKGLEHSKKYYVRAYAVNSVDIAYGNQQEFTTLSGGPIVFNPDLTYGTLTDIEGNTYKTVNIGTMVVMAENLRTRKYNDNTSIPGITDDVAWVTSTTPGYCWFDNDSVTYKSTYGALYNWYAVNTGKLCPSGWHVPTTPEFDSFITEMGGSAVTGGKMKETGLTHWLPPNTGATNETGYTGLPGGRRSYNDGSFINIGASGFFWSASEESTSYAGAGQLDFNSTTIKGDSFRKTYGMSVRCIKNK